MFTFEGEFSKMDDKKDMYIFGPASMEILDVQGDIITIDAVRKALPQLLRRARLTVDHSDNIVGEILEVADVSGRLYKTEVRPPEPQELSKFQNLVEGKEALFVLARVWDDTEYCVKIRKAIAMGQYKKYSIAGNVLKARPCTREEYCGRLVSDINLSAVTICNAGANPAAEFDIIKRGNQMAEEKTEKSDAKAPAQEFLTKADFEAYKSETLAKISEITELFKKKFEEKEEAKIEKEAKKPEEKEEGILVDMTKMKDEIKAELKDEFIAVQKSHAVEEKEPTAEDISKTLSKIKFR